MYEVAGLKEFVWCSKTTDLRQLGILYTGHTQNNGAVLIVNTIKTAPLFCVCPVYKDRCKWEHHTRQSGQEEEDVL
jgi:hypothetical protein